MQLSNIDWSKVSTNAKRHAKKHSANSDISNLAQYLSIDINAAERTVDMAQEWTIEQITEQIRENVKRVPLIDFCLKLADSDQTNSFFVSKLDSTSDTVLYHELIVSEENPIDPISLITRTPESAVEKILHSNIEICLNAVGIELAKIAEQEESPLEEIKQKPLDISSDEDLTQLFNKPLSEKPEKVQADEKLDDLNITEIEIQNHIDKEPLFPEKAKNEPESTLKHLDDGNVPHDNLSLSDQYGSSSATLSSLEPLDSPRNDKHYREKFLGEGFSTGSRSSQSSKFNLRNIAIVSLAAVLAILVFMPFMSGQQFSNMLGLNNSESLAFEDENFKTGTDIELDGDGAEVNDRVDELGEDNLAFKIEANKIRRAINNDFYTKNPDKAPQEPKNLSHEEIIKLDLEHYKTIPSESWQDGSN